MENSSLLSESVKQVHVTDTTGLEPISCEGCKAEILKAKGNADLEIKCLKCSWINYPMRKTIKERIEGLKGPSFMVKALSHFCWQCHRLMFRSRGGEGTYIKYCTYCKVETTYDTVLMRKGKMKYPVNERSVKSRESLAI